MFYKCKTSSPAELQNFMKIWVYI